MRAPIIFISDDEVVPSITIPVVVKFTPAGAVILTPLMNSIFPAVPVSLKYVISGLPAKLVVFPFVRVNVVITGLP